MSLARFTQVRLSRRVSLVATFNRCSLQRACSSSNDASQAGTGPKEETSKSAASASASAGQGQQSEPPRPRRLLPTSPKNLKVFGVWAVLGIGSAHWMNSSPSSEY
eukprot:gnl/TRDRNA2_/TRDRNA2_168733_c0_seq4.p2 gnl/TRDRNA2_/TRDRNA2_168733_c0~~gnl/TRDRNA2_/TRDRNA2_168733_c0_seq4.p2  ORF type:complete len:106 (-),score=12.30 gnl/TRDRNA2_/TRDRNA2_168733_c0_seq4:93-410(-)